MRDQYPGGLRWKRAECMRVEKTGGALRAPISSGAHRAKNLLAPLPRQPSAQPHRDLFYHPVYRVTPSSSSDTSSWRTVPNFFVVSHTADATHLLLHDRLPCLPLKLDASSLVHGQTLYVVFQPPLCIQGARREDPAIWISCVWSGVRPWMLRQPT